MTQAEEYWEAYLAATHQNKEEAAFSGELMFEDEGFTGMSQLALILGGQKTAVFSPFPAYEINREPLPLAGEVYIVEDTNGKPRCIIEVTDVNVIPFGEVSWEMAQREGEDENLQAWREKQREYMSDEADLCGFDFNDGTKVVFEVFKVIYR
ncbi:MAG: ASCH domain-containing protein [Treponema sp.]|nr:ASCH domain-containing protein [Treponema sp.]MBR4464902.1 ASCH domain-containing protein [Treponema sp.]